jgi:putative PEP-CTERM system TPR-repeat lipoprotein
MHYFGKVGKQRALRAGAAAAVLLLGGLTACGKSESSATLLAEAKQFQAKGDTKAAIIQLKNAVLKNPEDAQARLLLGTLYVETGDAVSAEKELRKAQSLGASAVAVLPPLVQAMLAQLQFQKVLDATEPAEAIKDPRLLAARGDALLALKKTDLAMAAYDVALAVKPDFAAAMIGQARVKLAREDMAGALALAAAAVARNPQSADAWMFKGDLARFSAKGDDAMAAYDRVLAIDPGHRSVHIERANVQIAAAKYDAARKEIDAAHKAAPANLMVSYTQALLDFTQGKHAAALESLQKVLRGAPEHLPTILMAGATELALGQTAQAEQHLSKYLQANPDNRYARKLVAATLLKVGRTADAQATLAPALRGAGAQDPQALSLAGEIALQGRDYAGATAYFEQASALAPNTAVLHTAIAQGRLGQGDDERAIAELEQATKLDAGDTRAGMLLVLTEMRLQHMDKALAAASRLDAQRPNDAMVKNLKGSVLLRKGDVAGARAAFEAALALQPAFFPAVANLAELSIKDNKPDEAKQRLSAFVAKQPKSIEALDALAKLAVARGDLAEATTWLEKAAAENPDAVAPAVALVVHYLRVGEIQKALTLARKVQVANAASPEALDVLGQAQLANGDGPAALDSYNKLTGLAPKSPSAWYRMAVVHMRMNNDVAATEDLKKAVALQPDFLDAQVAQVQMAGRAKRYDVALAIARTIQKQRPTDAYGFSAEADVLMAQKKVGAAAALYERAYALNKSPALLTALAEAFKQAGREKEADARIAAFQREHPGDAVVGMYVIAGHMAAKRYDLAAPQLAALAQAHPRDPVILNNLAWAYAQQKDARALQTAEQGGRAAAPHPPKTLGVILLGQGDTARGLPLLQKAVAAAPRNPATRFHLAEALVKAGDKGAARKELEKLLADNKDFVNQNDVRALLKTL